MKCAMNLFVPALFVLASGCAAEDTSIQDGDHAASPPRIAVLLTDAPGDFESVWVEISRVEIESAETGWLALVEEPQMFDLLTLQNGVTAALGDAVLAPGLYGQLRLIVDSASVVVAGVESPLTIASGAETGIKIPLAQQIEDNMTYSLTLDYDADKSIKSTGKGYLMTPVIQVKELVGTPTGDAPENDAPPSDEPVM
jgi:hypothetical protein